MVRLRYGFRPMRYEAMPTVGQAVILFGKSVMLLPAHPHF